MATQPTQQAGERTITHPSHSAHPGPPPSRRHFQDNSQHPKWDFLKGEGPSSTEAYYYEEKKSFKPGWNSLRPQAAIQQDMPRKQGDGVRQQRQELTGHMRQERLQQWGTYNKFNPITGQELRPAAGAGSTTTSSSSGGGQQQQGSSWGPAQDPWQHQRLGLKPVQNTLSKQPANPQVTVSNPGRQQQIYEMRKERLANDGLFASKRVGGTVKDIMTWQ